MSTLRVLAEREPLQYVDGELRPEPAAAHVATFTHPGGRVVRGLSFPSPEAVVTPAHTGARTIRTYMAVGAPAARGLHAVRRALPALARAAQPALERLDRGGAPDASARFVVLAEATKGERRARVALEGRDPYGLTGALQAFAAERALAGAVAARGVVAPSVAFPPREAIAALAATGLRLVEPA